MKQDAPTASPTKNKSSISFKSLIEKWPSTIVAREEVGRFSGGILSPKSMANIDSSGEGPEGAIRVGRKIAYPVDSLVCWMERRATRRAA